MPEVARLEKSGVLGSLSVSDEHDDWWFSVKNWGRGDDDREILGVELAVDAVEFWPGELGRKRKVERGDGDGGGRYVDGTSSLAVSSESVLPLS